MEKICAVIVTFNRKKLLEECLNAVYSQSCPLDNIIVINNNSSDGTKNYLNDLKKIKNNLTVINLEENIGGAGGFNRGMKTFIDKTDDEIVWIMDDDTIPESDALERLMNASNNIEDYGYLASNVRWTDQTPALMNIPFVENSNWIDNMINKELIYPRIRRATFVSLIIKRKIINDVGYPISDFFIWGDDAEYTERIAQKYKCYFVPNSIIVHKMLENNAASIVTEKPNKQRLSRYQYAYRNRVYYYRYLTSKDRFMFKVRVMVEIKDIIFKSEKLKFFRIRQLLSGLIKGYFFNPKIESVRGRY